MVVGVCLVTITIPEARSLKDKRRVIRSLIQRIKSRFNVSVAEVEDQDIWQTAGIGFAAVSNSARHADETLSTVLNFIENNLQEGLLTDVQTEILHL